jgi:hypothetical protein
MTDDSLSPTPRGDTISTSPARQRATEPGAKQAGEGEVAGRTLVASHEPVQAVLVARLDGPAARLQAKRAVFAVFFTWTSGGSLRDRAQRGHALIARLDPDEAERQQSRLTLLVNIAQAVGGPPPEALRPSRGAERDGDPLVSIFFRPTPGPASLVARRHAARDSLATLHGRAYEQALRLYHAIGALTDAGARGRGGDDDAA